MSQILPIHNGMTRLEQGQQSHVPSKALLIFREVRTVPPHSQSDQVAVRHPGGQTALASPPPAEKYPLASVKLCSFWMRKSHPVKLVITQLHAWTPM